MSEEAPGVSPVPLWAAKRPGNLSWCSRCQPGCCATAVCHPGGWGLLKGNHVNLSVTIQCTAVGWSWQAWQSRRTVLKAVLQRHNVDSGFSCLSILLSWNRLRHVEFSFRAGHLGWTYYPLSFFHSKNSDLSPGYLWTERDIQFRNPAVINSHVLWSLIWWQGENRLSLGWQRLYLLVLRGGFWNEMSLLSIGFKNKVFWVISSF